MSDVKPFVLDFDLVSGFCTSGKVKPCLLYTSVNYAPIYESYIDKFKI